MLSLTEIIAGLVQCTCHKVHLHLAVRSRSISVSMNRRSVVTLQARENKEMVFGIHSGDHVDKLKRGSTADVSFFF